MIWGKITNRISSSTYISRNGVVPLMTVSMRIRPTPATTFWTVPTGGVISPIQPTKMNMKPKYTGSIPALTASGAHTGPKIKIVGVRSMAVPTTSRKTIISAMNSMGSVITLAKLSASMFGRSASVIM